MNFLLSNFMATPALKLLNTIAGCNSEVPLRLSVRDVIPDTCPNNLSSRYPIFHARHPSDIQHLGLSKRSLVNKFILLSSSAKIEHNMGLTIKQTLKILIFDINFLLIHRHLLIVHKTWSLLSQNRIKLS